MNYDNKQEYKKQEERSPYRTENIGDPVVDELDPMGQMRFETDEPQQTLSFSKSVSEDTLSEDPFSQENDAPEILFEELCFETADEKVPEESSSESPQTSFSALQSETVAASSSSKPETEGSLFNDSFEEASETALYSNEDRPLEEPSSPSEEIRRESPSASSETKSSESSFPQEPFAYAPPERKEKPVQRPKNSTLALLMTMTVLLSGASGYAGSYFANRRAAKETPPPVNTPVSESIETQPDVSYTPLSQGQAPSLSDVVSKTADSVVEINTRSVTETDFFGDPVIGEGAGSGVIIRKDGYIVTNYHVIANAQDIRVRLTNGKTYEAALTGADKNLDVAVIKIEAQGLTAASYGDSDKLKVGDTAIAIGNPLGELGGTVTSGIISALNRDITIGSNSFSLIQTSAAVNRGNSGGGLFDAKGDLVGIIVAKSASRAFMPSVEGIGFAIPINEAKVSAESIIETGRVPGRVHIGIRLAEIPDKETALANGVQEPGLYIAGIMRENGFKPGDRIISMEGGKVSTAEEVQKAVSQRKAGDKMRFEIDRGGNVFELIVTLVEDSE
ncbi:MAG: trypsin-like peptidase domain-containing protein [Peptostreptococcaceae bacterium]|nr:trypsin-like peptidase domain-containing protein [Peptostreptococcaceae bacterium]